MWSEDVILMILNGVKETLYMTLASTILGYVLGLPMGICLAVSDKDGLKPNAVLYKILDLISNIVRSIPFLILLILVIPLTRLLVGQSYGSSATIVPLVVAAVPFIARMVESSAKEVDEGVIEAAKAMGAGNFTIITRGSSRRSKNISDHRSDNCNRDDPRILSYGRNCRWRWTWRYRHPLWILSISV